MLRWAAPSSAGSSSPPSSRFSWCRPSTPSCAAPRPARINWTSSSRRRATARPRSRCMVEENREAQPPRGSVIRTTSLVLVLAAVAGTAVLFVREHRANARQVEQLQRELDRGPVVRIARVKLAPAEHVVSLPAEVRADRRAVLYAKVSGYVKRVLVDRGDRVKEGQQLAVLESPDLEAQVAAAAAEAALRRHQRHPARGPPGTRVP